ncbi:ABC transporter permease subunit [Ensifer sesbaniae]|jgi:putrescine transport system permease protein|uniref:ABC transporter permease subunit n=1 Tax=Ensifer sesbaniae TaxID=1214071 RepID=UPI001568F555|nr:ABC transporter permease subunit [Ensifer sesbaniae]MCK3777004.1 ABC transporter permease subunit [Ensifer sesbaniae]NRQ17103.1 Putrescine transport system permease protein PotH [Ensifer sesbaniae]
MRTAATPSSKTSWGRRILIAIPYAWLLVLFLAPFALVAGISLSTVRLGMPPFEPLTAWDGSILNLRLNFENFLYVLTDDTYLLAYLTSLKIAAISTAAMLFIAYPLAYGIASCSPSSRSLLVFLVIVPFWSSMLIRVYSWMSILRNDGLLNALLLKIGLIGEPLRILNTETAIYIGIVYTYLPFMVLPIYSNLSSADRTLIEAARDLGCARISAFWRVTFPLSLPGVLAGCALVFIPVVGEFVIPDLLGGADTQMIGRAIWLEFFNNRDWPMAAAVTIVLLALLVVPIVYFQSRQAHTRT